MNVANVLLQIDAGGSTYDLYSWDATGTASYVTKNGSSNNFGGTPEASTDTITLRFLADFVSSTSVKTATVEMNMDNVAINVVSEASTTVTLLGAATATPARAWIPTINIDSSATEQATATASPAKAEVPSISMGKTIEATVATADPARG